MRVVFQYVIVLFLVLVFFIAVTVSAENSVKIADITERVFDFVAYSVGLVGLAITFATAIVAMCDVSCSDELVKLVETHFIPTPFQELKSIDELCGPKNEKRPAGIKVIHAIAQSRHWEKLTPTERVDLCGSHGLDAGLPGTGRTFRLIQQNVDKNCIIALAIVVTVSFFLIPVVYLLRWPGIAMIALSLTYAACVSEIAICMWYYWNRSNYLRNMSRRLDTSREEVDLFLGRDKVQLSQGVTTSPTIDATS